MAWRALERAFKIVSAPVTFHDIFTHKLFVYANADCLLTRRHLRFGH